jgi:hypothetical protein
MMMSMRTLKLCLSDEGVRSHCFVCLGLADRPWS